MKKYYQYIKENLEEVDPYGEEQWGDERYYILYVAGHVLEPFNYFYLDCVEGYINHINERDGYKIVNFSYDMDGGERRHATSYGAYICDRREDFDLDRMKRPFYNMEGDNNKELYGAKKDHGAFISKNAITKEEFLRIANDIYDDAANGFIPKLKDQIDKIKNQIKKLKNKEGYFRINIE
jgi:hypothetical protein